LVKPGIPLRRVAVLAPEDQARADLYALQARLYAAAPDATLLANLGAAPPLDAASADSALAASWRSLIEASAAGNADAIAEEYQALFVGVGQSEVSLHGSAYVGATAGGSMLVQVRASLAQLNLARRVESTMYEDHLAAVFETMRLLIGGDGNPEAFAFDVQREFFVHNIEPWADRCCSAICNKDIAIYYSRAAQFTKDFLAVERDSLAIGS
jgi:TorA maturation chaperone TorD